MANAFIGRKRIIYWTLATDAAKFVGNPSQIERICEGNKPASWVREAISAMKSKLVARPSCRETNTKFQWEIDGDVKTMRSLRCTKAIAAMMLTMSLFGLTICDAQAQAQPQDQNGAQM